MGALRAGADIVRVASPAYIPMPDLIYERLEGKAITGEHLETILPLVDRADVVVCGMGLGRASHDVVLAIAEAAGRAVFDADAPSPRRKRPSIPHTQASSPGLPERSPRPTSSRAAGA
jgi:NAD(P)H-hydrate epimerase